MNNSSTVRTLWKLFSEQKWDESKFLFHSDFQAYWPQSKEKFVGSENFVEMNRSYPGNHVAGVRHIFEKEDTVVCTVFISADTGQTAFATSWFEFKDEKIYRVTEYWGEEYEAPKSREKWRL